MVAIPFGFVGALFGHLIMGFNLSILSIFGMVGLTGVVVNDSLVLVYAANRFRSAGDSAHAAIIKAGAIRFRAILLTSLTTFAGLSPMIFERSVQAQFLIPMAISLGFGVLFATFITLLLVPCGFMIREDILNLVSAIKAKLVPPVSNNK
jgi:multidrug efflux pump subunit AcrB